MEKIFTLILSLAFFSCTQNMDMKTECSQMQSPEIPQENLPWLKELIKRAKNDNSGNYLGYIWLENYRGQDIFVTNMMLGSGGIMNYYFDCCGNHFAYPGVEHCTACDFVGGSHFYIEDENFSESLMTKDIIIYSPPGSPK